MKNFFSGLLLLCLCLPVKLYADNFLNLTPVPKDMAIGEGTLVLPETFVISTSGLPDSLSNEAEKFAATFTAVTGRKVTVAAVAEDALVRMSAYNGSDELGIEGYTLKIAADGVDIAAVTSSGFFYAFQTLKKLLPPCVMAGVPDDAVTMYELPVVRIVDSPRFEYRGFMLDVSRHFFSLDQLKRMLDVMSYYKMNRFHWHLTDDQGWRIEIKKYPRLQKEGNVRANNEVNDFKQGQYYTYEPYGPYYYTQDEARELVAYARQLHIEIVPEVEFPGHSCATVTAYPEFSCSPNGAHEVKYTGGIFADVLNVANPGTLQFAKDVLDEIVDIFPYRQIHIGGDECPVTAWRNNAECQAKVAELGLGDNYRALQSHFVKALADHLASKEGTQKRQVIMWNESMSSDGVDIDMMQQTDGWVMCWEQNKVQSTALLAAKSGMKSVITPWGPYYINRKPSADPGEVDVPGNGSDNLQSVYAYMPVPASVPVELHKYYAGVQGTFWTEHVSDPAMLEYLAFPRLMAIAETGWSPAAKKDFESFRVRMKADMKLFDYKNYTYGRHFLTDDQGTEMVMPKISTAEKSYWYRIVTRNEADANRKGKCIELLREGAPALSNSTARVGRLWSGTVVEAGAPAYDYQWWALKEDPARPGFYALVCKASPDGSLNSVATAQNNTGRWDYDATALHYDFVLGDRVYGRHGDNYVYSIRSNKSAANLWMNMAASGQQYSINQYGDPNDGNSGQWEFQLMPESNRVVEVTALMATALERLDAALLYAADSEKSFGRYAQAEAEVLRNLMKGKDPATMEETELETYYRELLDAVTAFDNSQLWPVAGQCIRFSNAADRFNGTTLCDDGEAATLKALSTIWKADVWRVTSAERTENGMTLQLQNTVTGRYIAGTTNPVGLATSGTTYTLTFDGEHNDFVLSSADKALFPLPETSWTYPGCLYVTDPMNSGKGGVRQQGAAWVVDEAVCVTYRCVDEAGNLLRTFHHSARHGAAYSVIVPILQNYEALTLNDTPVDELPVWENVTEPLELTVVYKRTAYALTIEGRTMHGALLYRHIYHVPLGGTHVLSYDEVPYFSFVSTSWDGENEVMPQTDMTVVARYATEAICGFRAVGEPVTVLADGKAYLLFNAHTDTGRNGYLNVNEQGNDILATNNKTSGTPYYVWTLQKDDTRYKVRNENGLYMSALNSGGKVRVTAAGESFTFTLNPDAQTWMVKGSNNLYWNGNAGSFTGWSTAHAFKLFEFEAEPYFTVTCTHVDESGKTLGASSALVKAGEPYVVFPPVYEGKSFDRLDGDVDGLDAVGGNLNITLVYKTNVDVDVIPAETGGNGKYYDLGGRVYDKVMRPGIYIRDGKVQVIK